MRIHLLLLDVGSRHSEEAIDPEDFIAMVKPNELSMTGESTDQRLNVDSTQSSYRRRKQKKLKKKNTPRGVVRILGENLEWWFYNSVGQGEEMVSEQQPPSLEEWNQGIQWEPRKKNLCLGRNTDQLSLLCWFCLSIGFTCAGWSPFCPFLTPASRPALRLDPHNTFSSALTPNDPF